MEPEEIKTISMADVYKLPRYKEAIEPIESDLNALQKFAYGQTLQVIHDLRQDGYLNYEDLEGPILDFGTGMGGSAIALSNFTAKVTAIDSSCDSIEILRNTLRIGRIEKIICADGIEYLRNHPGYFKMVFAAMLGPLENNKDLAEQFAEATINNLQKGGKVVIYSDPSSIHTLLDYITKYHPQIKASVNDNGTVMIYFV